MLLNPENPFNEHVIATIKPTAQALGLEVHLFGVRGPGEFEAAFAAMEVRRLGAVMVMDDAILIAHASAVAMLMLERRLPSSGWPGLRHWRRIHRLWSELQRHVSPRRDVC